MHLGHPLVAGDVVVVPANVVSVDQEREREKQRQRGRERETEGERERERLTHISQHQHS